MLDTDFDPQSLLRLYRTHDELAEAPALIAHIVNRVTPSMQARTSDGSQHTKASHGALPIQSTPLDDADDFYERLAYWAMFFARRFAVQPPVTLLRAFDLERDVRLPADAIRIPERSMLLAADVCAWLQDYENPIATQDDVAGVYEDDIHDMIAQLRGRYPTAPKPEHRYFTRPCDVCGEQQVRVFWTDAADGPQILKLRCRNCHHVIPVTELSQYLNAR